MPAVWRVALVLLALCVACSRSDASGPQADSEKSDATGQQGGSADDTLDDLAERSFPLLIWAAHTVQQEYFDKSRIDPRAQLVSAVTTLGMHTPEFFAEVDPKADALHVDVRAASKQFSLDGLDELDDAADRLEDVLEFTQGVLDLEPEPLHELEYVAINGLFAPLDPHTILLTPEEHTDLGVRTKGEFGGIGAQIRAEGRRIVILRVLPEMPAEAAGIESGDVVLKIDGVRTVNMTAAEAQQLLRGPVGTPVAMKLRRGKATLNVSIERAVIKIDSVEATMLPDAIAYLRITNFQENTAEQVQQNLIRMGVGDNRVAGVVFDLRGNSGGLLTQATAIVDQLVDSGELVIVRSAVGREVDPAQAEALVPPQASVVVLVDEQAASASEIVSGGVKALGRGVVLGRASFGKGTVQMIRPAAPYGRELALKLTVAEYLVAGDRRIQSRGVVPDLELSPVELLGIPGIVRYFDNERFERERERSRTANLPSARHDLGVQPAEPHARLRYLWTDELPASVATGPDGKPRTLPEEMADPEIRIAHQVALELRGTDAAEARLAAVERAAQRLGIEEDARIVSALSKTDIDWSRAAAGLPQPDVEVAARLTQDAPIKAGEPFALHIEVTNKSSTAAHRVHLITDCIHDELDGIELVIGSVAPGQTLVRQMKLHVMPWHTDFTDEVDVDVHVGEPDASPDATASVLFEIEGAPRPSLSYDYWIVDDPVLAGAAPKRPPSESIPGDPPFSVRGNGDGVLQPGEKVLLAFVATNRGAGNSPDARAVLRNLSGKQGLLEEGAVPLGAIASGRSASGAFGITIGDDADPGVPFEVELIVGDAVLRTSAQDKLRFRIHGEGATLKPDDHAFVVDGEPVRLYAGAHASTPVAAEVPPGTKLATVGRMGAWHVLEAATPGRRYFLPADLPSLAAIAGKPAKKLEGIVHRPAVLPPAIVLQAYPRVTSAGEIKLEGMATHPTRVRDVVVLVRPPGPSQLDHKVHYVAARGNADTKLGFEADVPLEPGGNRITILARDGAKVEHRHDVWVYREPAK